MPIMTKPHLGYVPTVQAHTPPPPGSWDRYAIASGVVPDTAFAVATLPGTCARCCREPAPVVAWCTPHGDPTGPTSFHKAPTTCPGCAVSSATEGCVAVPLAIVSEAVPPEGKVFSPGAVWMAWTFQNDRRLGYHQALALLARHCAGDFGDHGRLETIQPTSEDRRAGVLASVPTRSALAALGARGLVLSRFTLGPKEDRLAVHVATNIDGQRGNQSVILDRPI